MPTPSLSETLERIRQLNNRIEGRLREQSRADVLRHHGPLLLDSLSGKQIRLIHAVRHGLLEKPEGLLLRDLADQIGVTPPSASVMVDALVKRGFLERIIDPEDRRAVRIRLSGQVATHFDLLHRAALEQLEHLAEQLGKQFIDNWLEVLLEVDAALMGHDILPSKNLH